MPNCAALVSGKVQRSRLGSTGPLGACLPRNRLLMGCTIKGNISNNGKIYHLQKMASYAKTRITLSKGERWFCSEAEARAAGWRAPRR